MKEEYPILFTGNMVRAILAGKKSQTRRIIPNQEWNNSGDLKIYLPNDVRGDIIYQNLRAKAGVHKAYVNPHGAVSVRLEDGKILGIKPHEFQWIAPRYGKVGGRLWVREMWCSNERPLIGYAADSRCGAWINDGDGGRIFLSHGYILEAPGYIKTVNNLKYAPTFGLKKYGGKWRPSIFMPRWACRITLEITDLRIQRLNDISEEDAKAEGVTLEKCTHPDCQSGNTRCACDSYRGAFCIGWDSINAKRGFSWGSNPWVWCISFKRINEEKFV